MDPDPEDALRKEGPCRVRGSPHQRGQPLPPPVAPCPSPSGHRGTSCCPRPGPCPLPAQLCLPLRPLDSHCPPLADGKGHLLTTAQRPSSGPPHLTSGCSPITYPAPPGRPLLQHARPAPWLFLPLGTPERAPPAFKPVPRYPVAVRPALSLLHPPHTHSLPIFLPHSPRHPDITWPYILRVSVCPPDGEG